MDAGIGFAVHHHISRRGNHFLPQRTAFGAEGVGKSIHPILHFAGAEGGDGARIGLEMNIPVALHVSLRHHVEGSVAIGCSHRILLDRNRNCRSVQDIAVSGDADGSRASIGIATCHDGDVAFRRFGFGIEIGIRLAVVSHVIFRACIARCTVYVHESLTFDGGIIPAAYGNGTTFVGAVIVDGGGPGVSCFLSGRLRCIRVTGKERRLAYGGGGVGGNIVCVLDVRRAHGCTGSEAASIFGNNITAGLDGDSVLVVEGRLPSCDVSCRQLRCIGFDGGSAHSGIRIVGDGGGIHHAIAAEQGRAHTFSHLAIVLVFFGGFVVSRNLCFLIGGDFRRTDGDRSIGSDCGLRLATGTADTAGADGIDFSIHCVFMARTELRSLCSDGGASDSHCRFLVRVHFGQCHGAGEDAAGAGRGFSIGIVFASICRHIHDRTDSQRIRRMEHGCISHIDKRLVGGFHRGFGDAHAGDAYAHRSGFRFEDWRIGSGDLERLAREFRLISYSSLGLDAAIKDNAGTGARISAYGCANGFRRQSGIRICVHREVALRFKVCPFFHGCFRGARNV